MKQQISPLLANGCASLKKKKIIYIYIVFIYLFIWLHWVLIVACGLFSCSMWDIVPWPMFKLRPPALEARSHSYWPTRKALDVLLDQLPLYPGSSLLSLQTKFIEIFSRRVVPLSESICSRVNSYFFSSLPNNPTKNPNPVIVSF